ncbi:MAG: formyltransferase family protein [Chloroflexota bacterium]
MKITFLTTDDPVYLPAFYEHVLSKYGKETQAVYSVPPLYKNQTSLQAALRYYKTFGLAASLGLGARVGMVTMRGQSIASVCKKHGVMYELVPDVNAEQFRQRLRDSGTDLLISVSCPQIFKKPLIEIPQLGCLNIHGAILPHYRGVLPSFWMLANQEKNAGVSIYYVNEKIDAGELCGQRIFEIVPRESLDHFITRSKAIAAELLLEVLGKIEVGTITRSPLNLADGSYYSWPDKEAVKRFWANGHHLW